MRRNTRCSPKEVWMHHAVKSRTAVAFCMILAFACLSACSHHVPAENTLEEFELHIELGENEELLGKTKEEVYERIGHPDTWQRYGGGLTFCHGIECWDEEIGKWNYISDDGENTLYLKVRFSEEGLAEEVEFVWTDPKTSEAQWVKQKLKQKASQRVRCDA